jgi:hypothetical protein
MMDVATIVITASAISLVLQIVTIALVIDTRKKIVKEPPNERPVSQDPRDVKKQRDQESRFNRKPNPEHKSRPAATPPQNVEQVERSLRDINLRLKNAERDQEKERKRIKDSIGPSSPKKFDTPKPREQNEGFRRNDRPRHETHQNRTGDPQRPQREDTSAQKPSAEIAEVVSPFVAQVSVAPTPPPVSIEKSVAPLSSEPIFETSQQQPENLQHGRKVMVKRRILNLEEAGEDAQEISIPIAPTPPTDSLNNAENVSADSEVLSKSPDENETPTNATISFGR